MADGLRVLDAHDLRCGVAAADKVDHLTDTLTAEIMAPKVCHVVYYLPGSLTFKIK